MPLATKRVSAKVAKRRARCGGKRETSAERERRLTRLGYRSLAIGFNKAHLGEAWLRHFGERANRLFDLALAEWIRA